MSLRYIRRSGKSLYSDELPPIKGGLCVRLEANQQLCSVHACRYEEVIRTSILSHTEAHIEQLLSVLSPSIDNG